MSSISPTPQGEVGQSHSSRHTGLGSEVWGEPSAADARAEEEGDDVRPDRGRDGGGTAFGSFILPRHPPPSSNSSLPHGTYPPPTPEQPDVHVRSNARTTGVCLQLRNISLSPSTYRLWDYLAYGPALHTVITCATAPHSCNAQGCIRSATAQLSNVICGTDSRCRC